jgi:hypothetical protein
VAFFIEHSPVLEKTHVSCRHELETPFETIYSTFAPFPCSSTFGVELLQYGLPSAEESNNDTVAHQQVAGGAEDDLVIESLS